MKNKLDYRQILLKEIETRKLKNPSYNVSSLARLLKFPPSRLSEVLRGKVGISAAKAAEVATALKFSAAEKRLFLDLVCAEHGRNPVERGAALKRIKEYQEFQEIYFQYNDDNLKSIADWYHHAIIELVNLNPAITRAEISKTLGVGLKTTHEAVDRLIKLEVLEEDKKILRPATLNRESTRDIPSEGIKKLHEQILGKAAIELRAQPLENRDFSVAFFSFNKAQLTLAKERIKEFRRSFMKEFESSAGKDAVYCTSIQFFELTGKDK